MRAMRAPGSWFRNLRLVWKLLIPLVAMTLVVGIVGTYTIVRDLNDRAQIGLDRDLLREATTADAALRDLGLSLTDAIRFGANIEGVAGALERGDGAAARERLASVPAVQEELDLLVAADRSGTGLVEVTRRGERLEVGGGRSWSGGGSGELLARSGDRGSTVRSGFLRLDGRELLAVGGPVVADGDIVGTLIAGMDAADVAAFVSERTGSPVELYDASDRLVAASDGVAARAAPPDAPSGQQVRRTEQRGGAEVAVLYSPLAPLGERVGRVAVGVPTAAAFEAAGEATLRLVLLVLAAMAGVVVLGVLITRLVLRQVRPLVETSRALGAGELGARAPRFGGDELGEVARGMNLMAEQLQAGREELEMRVAARTEELERLYADLLRAEEGRSEFFAELVHEFRNELFAIRAHAEAMRDPHFEPDGDSWRAEYGQVIGDSAGALLHRVDEILELARAEAGRTEFELEDLRVEQAVADLRPTITALARRGELDAEFDLPRSLPPARADRDRFGQILMNLVSNAVKYTPPGGRVRVGARLAAAAIEVSVADTGIGVPEDAGERIFEPFYRVTGRSGPSGYASSGLGLAVTRRLVEGQGGRIDYVSDPGSGTAFTFTIPLAGTAPPEQAPSERPAPAGRT